MSESKTVASDDLKHAQDSAPTAQKPSDWRSLIAQSVMETIDRWGVKIPSLIENGLQKKPRLGLNSVLGLLFIAVGFVLLSCEIFAPQTEKRVEKAFEPASKPAPVKLPDKTPEPPLPPTSEPGKPPEPFRKGGSDDPSDDESSSAGSTHPVKFYGRFRVTFESDEALVEDTKRPDCGPYRFKKTAKAWKNALELLKNHATGTDQIIKVNQAFRGAFQYGYEAFVRDEVFMLPRWCSEKGRYLNKQFSGRWRIWMDDEIGLPYEERLERFAAAHPHGYGDSI